MQLRISLAVEPESTVCIYSQKVTYSLEIVLFVWRQKLYKHTNIFRVKINLLFISTSNLVRNILFTCVRFHSICNTRRCRQFATANTKCTIQKEATRKFYIAVINLQFKQFFHTEIAEADQLNIHTDLPINTSF